MSLDTIIPSWNPYFQLKNNTCVGLWSDDIIKSLETARPGVVWLGRNLSSKPDDPWTPSAVRTRTHKVTDYVALNGQININ